MYLFIYGTLKRGCSNNRWMKKHRFISEAQTLPGYALYLIEDYPGLVREEASHLPIQGEIWEIDEHYLPELDFFEGVHEQLYARVPIKLAPPHEELAMQTYLFLRDTSLKQKLGNNWSDSDIPIK